MGHGFQEVGDYIGHRKWLIDIKLGIEKKAIWFSDDFD